MAKAFDAEFLPALELGLEPEPEPEPEPVGVVVEEPFPIWTGVYVTPLS